MASLCSAAYRVTLLKIPQPSELGNLTNLFVTLTSAVLTGASIFGECVVLKAKRQVAQNSHIGSLNMCLHISKLILALFGNMNFEKILE